MAAIDLERSPIVSEERLQCVNLPPTLARMLAENARKRPYSQMTAKPEVVLPLMSLNLQPPSLVPVVPEIKIPDCRTLDENKMFGILNQVNVVMQRVGDALNTTIRASVERRTCDNTTHLFVYLQDFPFSLVGGSAVIEHGMVDQAPPPFKIYDAWRLKFFNSLQVILPPPLFSRMKRHVDKNYNMEWNLNLIESDDFHEMVEIVNSMSADPQFHRIWSTKPADVDPKNNEFATMRSALIRQIESEMKLFWTYEKIGVHLKMNAV